MKLSVKVTKATGEEIVKISPLAFIGWEKQTGKKMSNLAEGLGMEDLAILTMKQQGLQGAEQTGTVEEWLANVEELDPVQEGPTPGDAAPSDVP